ncbi:N-terminal EF-hand calcium-binding protein 1-like isoform X2 [Babylonia areolata]|uniref:N-terminal EF-hand calcium-binding protein 1-like isoform X2 n=1 Tax=Babylonia areolata TaxID=304850 RepID=UPI003FD4C0D5
MASAEAPEKGNGMTIFLDIFRRADKNDDGFISWEEFVAYFADGVMGKEELQTLFNEIDTHNTNNIDTEELCSYFSQHLGDFKEMFGTCEDLNKSMTKALYSTAQAYKTADKTGKFMMRFLMREIINQMSALQRPLEAASESLDEQARQESGNVTPVSPEDMLKKGDGPGIIPGRVVRRTRRQVSSQSNLSDVSNPGLGGQVERLAGLLDRLESKVNLHNFRDEEVVEGEQQLVLLVQREFQVKEPSMEEFRAVLRSYVDVTQGFHGCLNMSVVDMKDSKTFSVYEVWRTEKEYIHNCDSAATKKLVESTADLLVSPEMVHSMKIPASWWTWNM